jgi:hypothetical protein
MPIIVQLADVAASGIAGFSPRHASRKLGGCWGRLGLIGARAIAFGSFGGPVAKPNEKTNPNDFRTNPNEKRNEADSCRQHAMGTGDRRGSNSACRLGQTWFVRALLVCERR